MDRKSWQALLKKARKGDAESQYLVGVYFVDGEVDAKGRRVVKKDPARAVYWYRRAAEQGHPDGQMQLGACLSLGRGVRRDFKQAIIWTKKAVKQNASCSAHNLATIYRDMGQYRRAFAWYQRSVQMGRLDSWLEIGVAFFYGIGVKKDPVEACRCFKKILGLKHWIISELEREDASFMLALAYLEGKGVRPSLARARIMLESADREGDHFAAQLLLRGTGRRCNMRFPSRRSPKGK